MYHFVTCLPQEQTMTSTSNRPARLYSLDALRGLAALAIIFWHWQHFYFSGATPPANFSIPSQPLYSLFFLFYRSGHLAVDMFFTLSGFIFFWLYSKSISEGKVSAGEFFILRFSRLYPLHFLTLILVAVGQALYLKTQGQYFVYADNDPYHFILNVFFASSVGLEKGLSFNSPTWSVSVEVFLYVVFFLLCRWAKGRLSIIFALSLLGFMILPLHLHMGRGLWAFFLGCSLYPLYLRLISHRTANRWPAPLYLLTVVLWVASIAFSLNEFVLVRRSALWWLTYLFPILVLFPVTILSLAVIETQNGALGKKLSLLGDISYSLYLWHFPLQLLCVGLADYFHVSRDIFKSPLAVLVFFCYLMIIAIISHRYFEMPAQRWLRYKFHANVKTVLQVRRAAH